MPGECRRMIMITRAMIMVPPVAITAIMRRRSPGIILSVDGRGVAVTADPREVRWGCAGAVPQALHAAAAGRHHGALPTAGSRAAAQD